MPKCKINGQEVEVRDGATIIEAFKASGQDIAHYCWHPGLSVAGVCRLCMVQIEGVPKLQIACNTEVKEGMVITNQSPEVVDTVRWGMDFHLINHPLDCPICDQAGECGLQDQYMQYGKYDPEMAEPKVKKHKVVDLGPTVVLDSERCILCSRCVRFTDEVSKTHELGIFNLGDRSEIGTFEGKPLDNKYSLNTVDICPVGALTSKDFRFRQRVWYLKEHETICTGCSTGCSVKVYYNEEGAWRVRPRPNPEVNGYWMCDEGRDVYKYVNAKGRLLSAQVSQSGQTRSLKPLEALKELRQAITHRESSHLNQVAVVLTAQYSNEEYKDLLDGFCGHYGIDNVYYWQNNSETFESFDGLLIRGDKNPNTAGLLSALAERKLEKPWSDLEAKINSGEILTLLVVGPENQRGYPDIADKMKVFAKAKRLVWLAPASHASLDGLKSEVWQIPLRTFFEKSGTYINFQGKAQKAPYGATIVKDALTLSEVAEMLGGHDLSEEARPWTRPELKQNFFTTVRGQL